jgi:acyl-CoA thioesterase
MPEKDAVEYGKKIVDKMYENDLFSQWLGIELIEYLPGRCKVRMKVRKEMLNGFGIIHGGISYSLADSALAFAANSRGKLSMSIETSISHTKKVQEGDILTAIAEEVSLTDKLGIYDIPVFNQHDEKIGLFRGMVYRTKKDWEV